VIASGDKAEERQVVASRRVDNDWVVDSGLAAGERVVVEGIGKVRPGAQVRPVLATAASTTTGAGPSAAPPAAPAPGAPAVKAVRS